LRCKYAWCCSGCLNVCVNKCNFALSLANLGWEAACKKDPNLAKGLNVHEGKIYYSAVAEAHGYPSVEF